MLKNRIQIRLSLRIHAFWVCQGMPHILFLIIIHTFNQSFTCSSCIQSILLISVSKCEENNKVYFEFHPKSYYVKKAGYKLDHS